MFVATLVWGCVKPAYIRTMTAAEQKAAEREASRVQALEDDVDQDGFFHMQEEAAFLSECRDSGAEEAWLDVTAHRAAIYC